VCGGELFGKWGQAVKLRCDAAVNLDRGFGARRSEGC